MRVEREATSAGVGGNVAACAIYAIDRGLVEFWQAVQLLNAYSLGPEPFGREQVRPYRASLRGARRVE
jgi:hypothetical protein